MDKTDSALLKCDRNQNTTTCDPPDKTEHIMIPSQPSKLVAVLSSLLPSNFLAGCFIVNLLLLANVDDHRPISLRAAIFLLLSFSSSSSLPSFPSPLPSSAAPC